jgi:hypothetical protein
VCGGRLLTTKRNKFLTSLVNILISKSTQSGIQAQAIGSAGHGIKAKTYKKLKILRQPFCIRRNLPPFRSSVIQLNVKNLCFNNETKS